MTGAAGASPPCPPARGVDRPASTDRRRPASTGVDRPASTDRRRPIGVDRPATGDRPASTDRRRPTGDRPTGVDRSATDRRPTGDRPASTGVDRPALCHWQFRQSLFALPRLPMIALAFLSLPSASHIARSLVALALAAQILGHGLGSALAGVKCSQLIESKAKKRAIGTLALLSGGLQKRGEFGSGNPSI